MFADTVGVHQASKRRHGSIPLVRSSADVVAVSIGRVLCSQVTLLVVVPERLPDTVNEAVVHPEDGITRGALYAGHVTSHKAVYCAMVALKLTIGRSHLNQSINLSIRYQKRCSLAYIIVSFLAIHIGSNLNQFPWIKWKSYQLLEAVVANYSVDV